MKRYGQFCPVAKAAEILGDPWSILIVREMLLGGDRFNRLQRGLPRISPTVLNTRLKELEANDVIAKRPVSGGRRHEYRLTPAGRELSALIDAYATWGMRWARDAMEQDDLDITLLMFDMQRGIDTSAFPDGETVLQFNFPDLDQFSRWWLVCSGQGIDLCYEDPGKDVNCYITSSSKMLIEAWMGDIPLKTLVESGQFQMVGDSRLRRSFGKWFARSSAAKIPRPPKQERGARSGQMTISNPEPRARKKTTG
jgi:DNA-binding HxlR family transcriptional regulator